MTGGALRGVIAATRRVRDGRNGGEMRNTHLDRQLFAYSLRHGLIASLGR